MATEEESEVSFWSRLLDVQMGPLHEKEGWSPYFQMSWDRWATLAGLQDTSDFTRVHRPMNQATETSGSLQTPSEETRK